jgi:hypothetical protein
VMSSEDKISIFFIKYIYSMPILGQIKLYVNKLD